MLLFLLPGAFLLRLAARKFLVSLLNEPPRNTRTLDRTPFPERELPKNLLPRHPGVPVGRVGNPRSNSGMDLVPSRRAARVFRRERAHSSAKWYHVCAYQAV
jgi:hypothetical protein